MEIDLNKLSIKRLIGQKIIARLNVVDYYENPKYKEEILNLIKIGVGGFCLFQGNKLQTLDIIYELNDFAPIPLFFTGDYEFGLTMRLDDGTSFPHAMALGKTNNQKNTFEIAKAISQEIKEIGIDWNFAPVADINSNKQNPIINIRSFGENPEIVSKNIIEYIKASEEENIISCAKHFPGHGDTEKDSHLSLPIIKKTLNQLRKLELIPFIEAIKHNVPSIMVAHISLPEVDNSNITASLSKIICKDLLRNELKYNGIIITDALEMKAIVDNYKCEEIAELGLIADVDIFLMPENPVKLINTLMNLTEKNHEYESIIKNSVQRIFKIREKYLNNKPQKPNNFKINLDFPKLALDVALAAIETIGKTEIIPINDELKITGIALLQDDNIETPSTFFNMLSSALENDITFGFIDKNVSQKDIDDLCRDTFLTDLFIFPVFIKSKAYQGSVGIHENLIKAINEIRGFKPSIIIFLGNPYLSEVLNGDLHILTYSDSLPSMAATVVKLSGREAGV